MAETKISDVGQGRFLLIIAVGGFLAGVITWGITKLPQLMKN